MGTKSGLSAAGAMVGLESLLADMDKAQVESALSAETQTEVKSNDAEVVDAAPTQQGETTAVATKPKRVRKPAAPKVEKVAKPPKAPKVKAEKAPKAPKVAKPKKVKAEAAAVAPEVTTPVATPTPRVFFGRNKIGRLEHRLGADLGKFLILDAADVELDDAALVGKHDETKALIKGLGVKVQQRATNLIEFLSGKSQRLNPVIETALRILSKDGKIESGDKGNLHQKLLAKPYAATAARAMGNNTINMLKSLRIITESGKQCFVPNEGSALLPLVADRIALSFVDNEEAVALEEQREADERAARTQVSANQETLATAAPADQETPKVEEVITVAQSTPAVQQEALL